VGTLFYWYSMYYIWFMSRDIYELIEKMIDKKVKGADTYINNGSRWLIFSDEKKWVFELTKEGTLWYNYYFFERIFKLISLNVVENQHHITKWVEDAIQNGVKHTDACQIGTSTSIEDAIQNGVKDIRWGTNQRKNPIEDTIQNGVKETKHNTFEDGLAMEEAIQNGVKEIKGISDSSLSSEIFKVKCKQTIRDGVKRTELGGKDRKIDEIKDIVKNGVKETTPGGYLGSVEMKGKTVYQFEHSKQDNDVKDVLRDGIKETKYCELHSLMRADHIIRDGIKETWGYEKQSQMIVNEVINKGEKTIYQS
jgi:hypothetical protein